MKISTALFASILTICLTVSFVSGQIAFPDGSVQTTAFEPRQIASTDRFNFIGSNGSAPISLIVPAGRELVILQVEVFDNVDEGFAQLLSRLPSPNQNVGIQTIARVGDKDEFFFPGHDGSYTYPDAIVVVDEGRQLWVIGDTCQVLGYYRDKI